MRIDASFDLAKGYHPQIGKSHMTSGLDDLIESTLDSLDSSTQSVSAPSVKTESADNLKKLLEAVGETNVDNDLRDAFKSLQLGDLLDGIEDADIEDLMNQAESLLGAKEDSRGDDAEKLSQLMKEIASSDISDEDKRILLEVQGMVADLEAGKADESAVAARAFDLINKLNLSE